MSSSRETMKSSDASKVLIQEAQILNPDSDIYKLIKYHYQFRERNFGADDLNHAKISLNAICKKCNG